MPKDEIGRGVGFDRIRRITGYLVGTTARWNNAKRAEERDRVKHITVPQPVEQPEVHDHSGLLEE